MLLTRVCAMFIHHLTGLPLCVIETTTVRVWFGMVAQLSAARADQAFVTCARLAVYLSGISP